uniref:RNA helicase n=1 Tax=Myripristis murdjan TaxID=586833 RepID=A0A667YUT4_9TELE
HCQIQLVKSLNPSCIWARVICGPAGSVQSAGQYDDLQVRMNLFYHDVSLDVKRLKPSPLQEGQVCVVYWSVCKSWCRAVVESVLQDSAACQVHCLLVDHGEHLIVPSDQVRVAMHNFLQLPFWVRRFRLAGIKPTTLQVSICEEKTDVVLCEDEADCSSVELYLTIKNIKVNFDLSAACSRSHVFPVSMHISNTGSQSNTGHEHTEQKRCPMRRRYALSPADSYCWSSVARGCSTLLISHSASQPLSYLPPLLSHIQLSSCFSCCTSSTGPVTVLVCPGWEKVQAVSDLLEENQVTHSLHPVTVLLGVGKDEAKAVKIPKNCLLLVTTPFTLVRLLASHCFLFLRLCHLVLDEVDQLFSVAPDQMATILQHFQKVISSEETTSCPQQLVAVAKHWSSHMDSLLANHMPDPCVIITAAEEAALYGNVQQMILLALDSSKASVLLGALDFSPEVGQKTLIVANSAEEVEDVCKAVTCTSALCLKTHERLTHQFDSVIQQWRKTPGRGTQVILVTTNECLVSLGITDATCVVHYGFPSSPRLFGSRLACMVDNFRNVCDTDHTESCSQPVRSLLLISERNSRHVVGILRYLKRTNALMPPELLSFARGVHVAREEQKNNQPLCSFLKSFGVCRDSSVCPHRHRFNSQLDHSVLPASGIIQVLPLYIKTASVYCGRIVRKDEGGFDSLASEMAAYYAENKTPAKEPQEGGLYAVQEDERFHRVKVLSVPDRGDRLFFSVLAYFVDEGREEEVKSHQLLQLPAQFHSLPGQAVEIIVCQVKPADAEPDWHPKVTRAMSQKIRGLQHRARAVLSLGNTVFVDPMVRVTEVPGMKTLINEYNVQSEILSSGMGVSNPQHVDLLKALCREGVALGIFGFRVKFMENIKSSRYKAYTGDFLISNNFLRQKPTTVVDIPQQKMSIFHPQVRWYQRADCMVLTVKLMSPECQRCDFYPDRVVYSGRVNGRVYRADLELHANIAADRCCWEMKSNEPVIKLVKQQQGHWDRLLRNKVLDFTAGVRFVGNTGEDGWYVHSDSDSDSD